MRKVTTSFVRCNILIALTAAVIMIGVSAVVPTAEAYSSTPFLLQASAEIVGVTSVEDKQSKTMLRGKRKKKPPLYRTWEGRSRLQEVESKSAATATAKEEETSAEFRINDIAVAYANTAIDTFADFADTVAFAKQ